MADRKQRLEQEGPIRVEVGADGSYGMNWKSTTRPEGDVLVPDRTPRSELTMVIELGESVRDGVRHKRLWVRVSCDGAIGEAAEDQPVTLFRDDEHAIRWVQYIIGYLDRHLPERLRTMALLTVREAIAKSNEVHGIAEVNWKEFANSHGAIVRQKIKDSHGVHSGPKRFFKTPQQYLDFLAEAARESRSTGKPFTQASVAELANKKFATEGVDERTVRQWNDDYHVNWDYWLAKVNRRN